MFLTRRSTRLVNAVFEPSACLRCQWRAFSLSYQRPADKKISPAAPPKPPVKNEAAAAPPPPPTALDDAPRAYGRAVSEFTPKALNRPLGLPNPPLPGENEGIDTRTLKQRRDDLVDYEKHLARRKVLTQKISTPYFREWSNMRFHEGKSFLAPPRLFRADRALYFPNLVGQTLLKDKKIRDTTLALEGKVSVVSVFSSQWAENQAASFVSEQANPELLKVVKESGGVAQLVQINIEENALKNMIIKLFMPSLRKRLGESNWGRYFVVRRGITDEIRDAIGLLNSKVGYTYLLDGQCRIRWAGSGPSEADEREGLVRGVARLVEEHKVIPRLVPEAPNPAVNQKPAAPAA